MAFARVPKGSRRGYSLVELLIATSVGAVVAGGLAASVAITSRAMPADGAAASDANRSAVALSQLTGDLRHALQFSERTERAVTFTVPDRTGDGAADAVRYAWSGTPGDPLTYQFNGGAAVNLATNVQAFRLAGLTRVIAEQSIEDSSNLVVYETMAEAKAATNSTTLTISAPSGVAAGNLLIAAVVTDGNSGSSLTAPAGWTLVGRQSSSNQIGMGVWWRLATAADPASHVFTWTGNEQAYGWIMRFSGNHASAPINVFASATGSGASPGCPTVTTTTANALLLRLGGFDEDDVTIDNSGMTAHATVTVDSSNTGSGTCAGGAATAQLAVAGPAGTASFALVDAEEFVTFTLALAPD